MTRRSLVEIVSGAMDRGACGWGLGALAAIVLFAACGVERCSAAQPQSTPGSPFRSGGDSFFENFGVNFGFNIPARLPANGGSAIVGLTPQGAINPGGINFVQGGAAAAIPPFGGFVPGGNTLGFSINGPGGSATFGFSASQGSSRSMSSQTPSVTVMNGGTGFVSDASLRPFVTSVVPVVGGFAGGAQPMFTLPGAAPAVDSFGTSALGEHCSAWANGRARATRPWVRSILRRPTTGRSGRSAAVKRSSPRRPKTPSAANWPPPERARPGSRRRASPKSAPNRPSPIKRPRPSCAKSSAAPNRPWRWASRMSPASIINNCSAGRAAP